VGQPIEEEAMKALVDPSVSDPQPSVDYFGADVHGKPGDKVKPADIMHMLLMAQTEFIDAQTTYQHDHDLVGLAQGQTRYLAEMQAIILLLEGEAQLASVQELSIKKHVDALKTLGAI